MDLMNRLPDISSYELKEEMLTPTEDDVQKMLLKELGREEDQHPPDAFSLSQNDLRRELVDRGIQPKGFFSDDARRLQEEFDREFVQNRDQKRTSLIESFIANFRDNRLADRRKMQESELREERDEIERDPKLRTWIEMILDNRTPAEVTIPCNHISARAVVKALCNNTSVTSIVLSRNKIEDVCVKVLSEALKKNSHLRKLELQGNAIGPRGLEYLANALKVNKHLQYLGLEKNNLTESGKDYYGIEALAETLKQNNSLTSLNLFGVSLGAQGGALLAKALRKNETIVTLDVGNNNVSVYDQKELVACLENNKKRLADHLEGLRLNIAEEKSVQEVKRKERLALEQRATELEWIENQKREREEKRLHEAEVQTKAEDDQRIARQKQEDARIAAEKAKAEESAKKKSSKKGKGSKK